MSKMRGLFHFLKMIFHYPIGWTELGGTAGRWVGLQQQLVPFLEMKNWGDFIGTTPLGSSMDQCMWYIYMYVYICIYICIYNMYIYIVCFAVFGWLVSIEATTGRWRLSGYQSGTSSVPKRISVISVAAFDGLIVGHWSMWNRGISWTVPCQ